jgi:hypothetical protein
MPTQSTADAMSCLCILSHLNQHYQDRTTKINIHVRSTTTKNNLHKTKSTNTSPKQTYTHEWDLYHSIATQMDTIGRHNIQISTTKSNEPLSMPTHLPTLAAMLPTDEVQLHHKRKRVANDYTSIIRDISTTDAVFSFYQTKYKWNSTTIKDINWDAHGKDISSTTGRQYKSTCQLIHRWLPVNASYSKKSVGTAKLCPYCLSENEDHQHFLNCKHPLLTESWEKASDIIYKKIKNYNAKVNHQLIKLIKLAISEWRTTSTPQTPTFLDKKYHHLFFKQSLIGWKHILNGRFSNEWNNILTTTCDSTTTWISYCITQIWKQFVVVWKHQCDTNHGID